MCTLKMLRNIPILMAFPLINSGSSTISMSVTLPSAGEMSRFLSVGVALKGALKKDNAHTRTINNIASMVTVAHIGIYFLPRSRAIIITTIIIAGKTATCGNPYFVTGILIIEA